MVCCRLVATVVPRTRALPTQPTRPPNKVVKTGAKQSGVCDGWVTLKVTADSTVAAPEAWDRNGFRAALKSKTRFLVFPRDLSVDLTFCLYAKAARVEQRCAHVLHTHGVTVR